MHEIDFEGRYLNFKEIFCYVFKSQHMLYILFCENALAKVFSFLSKRRQRFGVAPDRPDTTIFSAETAHRPLNEHLASITTVDTGKVE